MRTTLPELTGAIEEQGPLVRPPAPSPDLPASSTTPQWNSGTPAPTPTPRKCGKRPEPSPAESSPPHLANSSSGAAQAAPSFTGKNGLLPSKRLLSP